MKMPLLEQQHFQFLVFAGRRDLRDVVAEPIVVECHAGTDQCRRDSQRDVPFAEDRVVDLFAHGIEQGRIGMQVLGAAVCLNSLCPAVVSVVQPRKEVGSDGVVRIENHGHVEGFTRSGELCDGIIERFGFRTVFEFDFQQADRQLSEPFQRGGCAVVGRSRPLHTVRAGIVARVSPPPTGRLRGLRGRRNQHGHAVLYSGRGKPVAAPAHRGEREDEKVGGGKAQQCEEHPVGYGQDRLHRRGNARGQNIVLFSKFETVQAA